jgi:hypothetical protein
MKNLVKKLCITLILLFTTLFSSCEKDLYEEAIHSSKKIKIREVTFDKLIKEEKFSSLLNSINDNNITSRSAFENQYGFTISNENVKVIETDTITSYTLAIKRDGVIYNTFFENLVIQKDIYNTKKAAIYKYIPDDITPTGHNSFIFHGEIEKSTINFSDSLQNITQNLCYAQHLMCNESWSNPGTVGTAHQATGFCQNIYFLFVESFLVICAPDNGGFENSGGGGNISNDNPFGNGPTPGGVGGQDDDDQPNIPQDYQIPDIITTPVLDNENFEDVKNTIRFYQSLSPQQLQWVILEPSNQNTFNQLINYQIANEWSSESRELALNLFQLAFDNNLEFVSANNITNYTEFTTISDLENFLNYQEISNTNSLSTVFQVDKKIISRTVNITPLHPLTVEIVITPSPNFSLDEDNSTSYLATNFLPGNSWTQTSMIVTNSNINNNTDAEITVSGYIYIGVKIGDYEIGTKRRKQIKIRLNKNTGIAYSSNVINLN